METKYYVDFITGEEVEVIFNLEELEVLNEGEVNELQWTMFCVWQTGNRMPPQNF